MSCPCGSAQTFEICCAPFLSGRANPPTAEALMRSRYVAYTRGDVDYIARTTAPDTLKNFDVRAARAWSAATQWIGLQILKTERGGAGDSVGTVEFVATYRQNGQTIAHRELSRFRRTERGEWRFVLGDARETIGKPPAVAAEALRAGRNDPCPCGSGKKFKKCCGAGPG